MLVAMFNAVKVESVPLKSDYFPNGGTRAVRRVAQRFTGHVGHP
jgi:hypothetical protein